jgi:riboflavin kinase/FMN adenylyltransferase
MRVIRNRPVGEPLTGSGPRRGAYAPGGSAVAIGNFDGVHRGHLALVDRCRQLAARGEAIAIVTFEPLPQAFFRPAQAPARLTTVYQKLSLLRAAGVDLTWLTRFDGRFAGLTAREFAEQVLVAGLAARQVVVGADFRFGRGREGDVTSLASLGDEFGFGVHVEPAVLCNGERISSSGIRRHLAAGEFGEAAALLGRPFRMEGHVTRGAGLGRKLGYPTANLRIRAEPSPLGGVLAAFARVAGGDWLPAVTNLGRRPAVGGGEPLLEVHFFDLDRDLYGQRLEVQFVAKLRDELNFASIDELVAQMGRDAEAARACLEAAALPRRDGADKTNNG